MGLIVEGRSKVIIPLYHSAHIWVRYLLRKILYFAQERSIRMWLDRNNVKTITADLFNPADLKLDIEDIQLPNDSYDLIVCNHVLEHVTDYKKALSELRRIIRPERMIIISFPVDPTLESVYEDNTVNTKEDRIKYFGQCDHLRVFGKDSALMLEKCGFHDLGVRYY